MMITKMMMIIIIALSFTCPPHASPAFALLVSPPFASPPLASPPLASPPRDAHLLCCTYGHVRSPSYATYKARAIQRRARRKSHTLSLKASGNVGAGASPTTATLLLYVPLLFPVVSSTLSLCLLCLSVYSVSFPPSFPLSCSSWHSQGPRFSLPLPLATSLPLPLPLFLFLLHSVLLCFFHAIFPPCITLFSCTWFFTHVRHFAQDSASTSRHRTHFLWLWA